MAVIKTYKATTHLSLNVVMPSGKNQHITFNGLSNGTSLYTTDNELIQQALESHARFGTLFRLQTTSKQTTKTTKNTANSKKATKVTKVTVSDIDAAKDYLADNFGLSRTKMKSTTAILNAAKANGIEFVGLSETEAEAKAE